MNRPPDSAGDQQHNPYLSASSALSSFSQTQFPSPLFSIDPRMQQSPQVLQPPPQHNGPSHASPAHLRHASNDGNHMQPPNSVSPRFNRATPARVTPSPLRPAERGLPLKAVTSSTIADAYVAFILYCNPNFDMTVDTSTLRSTFQSPPKSDNKDFDIFRLYELIKKFDAKEIKTWGQLALDLGVEAPDISKGQSSQKVQQYSVRLKRWMRAMHIDAFFEYLLGKQHSYFTDLPPPNDPYPATGRDGVMAEEDLAIRALDPSFRPKRGRRRNSETEQDAADGATKRTRTDDSHDVVPFSAHPGTFQDPWASAASAIAPSSYPPWMDKTTMPQTAVATTAPSHLRWQLQGGQQNPATPHPMTAQPTSMSAHIDAAFDNVEPRSAIGSGRRRRKHGPAVSSAWPSANAPGAKPRGRPPANRSLTDGPFSTFPADPATDRKTSQAQSVTPELRQTEEAGQPMLPPGRPGRLSLRVPQHTGGPVRLATPPPPRVTVNGEADQHSDGRSATQTPVVESMRTHPRIRQYGNIHIKEREIPGFAFQVLKRVLTSDLLRAEVVGRQHRLNVEEAKGLADAILERLGIPRKDTDESRDDIARITAASWLGLGEQLNVPLGPATSNGKRITVTRFRRDEEGYEEIVPAYDDSGGEIRDVFDLAWGVSLGGCNGAFELKGLSIAEPETEEEDEHDFLLSRLTRTVAQIGDPQELQRRAHMNYQHQNGNEMEEDESVDWKSKYLALEFGSRIVRGEHQRTKTRLLEKMLEVLL